jgi:hypothetical protein
MPVVEIVTANQNTVQAFEQRCGARIRYVTSLAIGQGHAHRFCLRNDDTILYFETGAGSCTHAQTFNDAQGDTGSSRIDFNANDFIVFSHWDEDHWWQAVLNPGTGNRHAARVNGNAFGATVLAPRQHMSATAQRALDFLDNNGSTVHMWSSNGFAPGIGLNPPLDITIRTATGSIFLERGAGDATQANQRNESGIVLTIQDTTGPNQEIAVLTGDCMFQHMPVGSPGRAPQNPNAICAPHHGSDNGLTNPPTPTAPNTNLPGVPVQPTVVICHGIGNHHGHPTQGAIALYGNKNYAVEFTADANRNPRYMHKRLATFTSTPPNQNNQLLYGIFFICVMVGLAWYLVFGPNDDVGLDGHQGGD